MKRILFIALVSFTLFSCNKNNGNSTPPADVIGSIHYVVNGNVVTMENKNFLSGEDVAFSKQLKGSILSATRFLLNAQKGTDNGLTTSIISDSLLEISYRYDSVSVADNPGDFLFNLDFNGRSSAILYNGDFVNIVINSYKDGRITGVFNARLSPVTGINNDYSNRNTIIVSDGQFDRVPVIY